MQHFWYVCFIASMLSSCFRECCLTLEACPLTAAGQGGLGWSQEIRPVVVKQPRHAGYQWLAILTVPAPLTPRTPQVC